MKMRLPADPAIDAKVDLLTDDDGSFLQARLNVSLPGLDRQVAQTILEGAHKTVCLMGLMLPLAVIVIPTQRIVAYLGWLNTLQGIVLPSTASAFALFFLTEYMRSIPRELFEAARADGAGHFAVYWRVALPVAKNGLVTIGILIFIIAWASYLWPLVVATNGSTYPISVKVAGYFAIGAKYPTSIVMTAALISAIPVIVFYVLFNRLVVDGVARSGITG